MKLKKNKQTMSTFLRWKLYCPMEPTANTGDKRNNEYDVNQLSLDSKMWREELYSFLCAIIRMHIRK